MTDSTPRGSGAPRYGGSRPEVRLSDQITGHRVQVTCEGSEIYIDWRGGNRLHLMPGDMGLSAWVVTSTCSESIIWLRLRTDAEYGRIDIVLPFYRAQYDQLRLFADALKSQFPGTRLRGAQADDAPDSAAHDAPATAPHDAAGHGPPPAEVAAEDRGRPGGGRQEKQVLPVVTIKRPPAQWADDKDWISLRPPAETEAMLQPAHEQPAPPEPEHSSRE